MVVSVVLFSLSIYFFSQSNILIAILLLLLSIWALSIFLGKVVFASAYLEGHMVRLLIKYNGSMSIDEIHRYYARYGLTDFVLDRLKKRGVIEIKNDIVELVEENLKKGFNNQLMMWGTRRVKL